MLLEDILLISTTEQKNLGHKPTATMACQRRGPNSTQAGWLHISPALRSIFLPLICLYTECSWCNVIFTWTLLFANTALGDELVRCFDCLQAVRFRKTQHPGVIQLAPWSHKSRNVDFQHEGGGRCQHCFPGFPSDIIHSEATQP